MKATRIGVLLVAVAVFGAAACAGDPAGPQFAAGTPDDLRALAREVFEDTAAAIPAHQDCLRGVMVVGVAELADRAEYRPDRAEIVLRIPQTAGQLTVSLVHELAHHLEFGCPAQRDVRAAFLVANGHAAHSPWFDAATWEQTPSEQFAGAVVELVVGHPDRRRPVRVSARALAVVAAWARGDAPRPATMS